MKWTRLDYKLPELHKQVVLSNDGTNLETASYARSGEHEWVQFSGVRVERLVTGELPARYWSYAAPLFREFGGNTVAELQVNLKEGQASW